MSPNIIIEYERHGYPLLLLRLMEQGLTLAQAAKVCATTRKEV